VSVIGQIYDPLGYLAPVTINFKILMHEVCRIKLGWDQPLTGQPMMKWRGLIEALRLSKPLLLSGHFFSGLYAPSSIRFQHCGFCGASNAATLQLFTWTEGHSSTSSKGSNHSSTRTDVSPFTGQTGHKCGRQPHF